MMGALSDSRFATRAILLKNNITRCHTHNVLVRINVLDQRIKNGEMLRGKHQNKFRLLLMDAQFHTPLPER